MNKEVIAGIAARPRQARPMATNPESRSPYLRRWISGFALARARSDAGDLIRPFQPPHGEFDVAAGHFAPALDLAHVAGRRPCIEERPGFGARGEPRQGKGLADKAVAGVL